MPASPSPSVHPPSGGATATTAVGVAVPVGGTRRASLDLVGVYRRIRYAEEAEAVCAELRTRYPDDAEVRTTCGAGPTAPAAAPDSGATGP